MRKLLFVVMVAGCWTSSKKEAAPPPLETRPAPTPVATKTTAAVAPPAEEPAAPPLAQAPVANTTPAPPPPAPGSGSGAAQNGVLGSTASSQGGAFASLTGTGDISSGFDDTNIYGGLLGSAAGATVADGTPTSAANLDKAIIRRYVRRNLTKITACYEKALDANASLQGTVTVKFRIGGTGKVATSSASGTGNTTVEDCVSKVIAGIAFPKPNNGKPVDVSYPFTLTPPLASGGFGTGGGGTGWGTIGTGRYGTIGHGGGGTGSGYGVGRGRNVPKVSIGQPGQNNESLDKAIVRRYIKRNIQKVLYCYEKQLLDTPTLEGKLTAKFHIDVDGRVTSSTATGLGNENVEKCVADTIKTIEFPKPHGGGSLDVTYPFTFKPAD